MKFLTTIFKAALDLILDDQLLAVGILAMIALTATLHLLTSLADGAVLMAFVLGNVLILFSSVIIAIQKTRRGK